MRIAVAGDERIGVADAVGTVRGAADIEHGG
jgi:hypothetical protein